MYYIELVKRNSESMLVIPYELSYSLKSIYINKQNIKYHLEKIDENKMGILISGMCDLPANSFSRLDFVDHQDDNLEIRMSQTGNYPCKFGDSFALIVGTQTGVLIKLINLSAVNLELEQKIINSKLNVIGETNNYYEVDLSPLKMNQLRNLVLLITETEQSGNETYHLQTIFLVDKSGFLPKNTFKNAHILLFVNSTIFKIELNKILDTHYNETFLISEGQNCPSDKGITLTKEELIEKLILPATSLDRVTRDLKLKAISLNEESAVLEIPMIGDELSNIKYPFLMMKQRNTDNTFSLMGIVQKETLSFNFSLFLKETPNTAGRWDIYLIDKRDNSIFTLNFNKNTDEMKGKEFYGIFKQQFNNKSTYNCFSRLYITNKNSLALVKNNISNLIKSQYQIKTKISNFSMVKNIIKMQVLIDTPNLNEFDIKYLSLVHRNKDQLNQSQFKLIKKTVNKNLCYLDCEIDLDQVNFIPMYWDVYLIIKIKNNDYLIKVTKSNKSVFNKVDKTISKYQYKMKNGFFVYPYITLSNDLAFTFRKQETFETGYYYRKEKLAYLISKIFHKQLLKKEIWIAFEKLAMSAHDSGYHFFDYVYKNKKPDNFYYVISKDSPEIKNLSDKKDKVLYFMSFKYFIYMFSAKLLISSDTKRNSYNLRMRKTNLGRALTKKPLVYLQHGVNGLKAVPDFYKKRDVFDLVIAPSEYEKKMIINHWGYSESEVVTTGLARWDVMEDRTNQIPYRQIFVMPTWRTWMDGMDKRDFLKSQYFKNYMEFLNSAKLNKILEDNNVKIMFFLHPKFKDYIDLFEFESDQIEKFGFLDVSLDDMIMKSSMMITDYSSVIWEMFYLKKPCLFYHFDKDKYLEYEGSYMEFDQDLFGDVAFHSEQLVNYVEKYIKDEFHEKEAYGKLRNEYFTYMDKNNSERIFKAIEENKAQLYKKEKLSGLKISHLIPFKIRRKLLNIKHALFK